MRRLSSVAFVFFALLFVASVASAEQDILVPAGTLLRCTMSEPNFSSATAQVGDPVLCHLGSVQEFGHNVFPRGAYMSGHLEAEKEPGHFFGKGYLKIVFDRIGTPNADVNVDTKIVGLRGYQVNKDGDIKGKGHAKRDVIEWMFPPLWPWKVITLPARGPRPTLKGEQVLSLRLMEDVAIPRTLAATVNSRDWRPPQAQIRPHPLSQPLSYEPPFAVSDVTPQSRVAAPMAATTAAGGAATNVRYVTSVDPVFRRTSNSPAVEESLLAPSPAAASAPAALPAAAPAHDPRTTSDTLTLIALRNESIWAVTSYWLAGDRLDYILPSGAHESCALNDVDLMRTTQLNSERGVTVAFHDGPSAQPTL